LATGKHPVEFQRRVFLQDRWVLQGPFPE